MEETNRIEEKLSEIKLYVKEIDDRIPPSFERYKSADVMVKRTLERDLQLINDAEIDILALLTKLKDVGIASSEENLIDRFNGILSAKALSHLKRLRRLRNILTHAYKNEHYDEAVFNAAKNLSEVLAFVKEVSKVTVINRHL
jgi:uncharacterized protein YutE (UPF0331/DUF86 family)